MGTLAAFIINSVLLGVGLAMDAFSVSMANGLNASRTSPGERASRGYLFNRYLPSVANHLLKVLILQQSSLYSAAI